MYVCTSICLTHSGHHLDSHVPAFYFVFLRHWASTKNCLTHYINQLTTN